MDEPNALWVTADQVVVPDACTGEDAAEIAAEIAETAAVLASSVMFLATGGRYPRAGVGIVRPNDGRCWAGPWWGPGVARPHPRAPYRWLDCPPCSSPDRIGFPWYPIVGVDLVTLDGVTFDPENYTLDQKRWLVRLDGQRWPRTQNVHVPATVPGTLEVQVQWGAEPPDAGLRLARFYANQLALGLCGGGADCQIPMDRISSITRQGVTMTNRDPLELLVDGLTGVHMVDEWIRLVNGAVRPQYPVVVASPETVARRSGMRWSVPPSDAS